MSSTVSKKIVLLAGSFKRFLVKRAYPLPELFPLKLKRIFSVPFAFMPAFLSACAKNIFQSKILSLVSSLSQSRRKFLRNAAIGLGLVLVLGAAAKATINYVNVLRLSPLSVTVTPESDLPQEVQSLETQTVGQAFDRDTTTSYTAFGQSQVKVTFEGVEEIHRFKVYGPAPYTATIYTVDASGNTVSVNGWSNINLSSLSSGWNSFELANPVNAQGMVVSLTPTAPINSGTAGISEMEFWGKGIAQNEAGGSAWDALLNSPSAPSKLLVSGREYLASAPVTGSTAVVIGGNNGPTTATFTVNLPMNGQSYRKAWLMYDVNGLSHWIAVPRIINGQEAAGGWPLPGTNQWAHEVEEIHPLWLNQGANSFTFTIPNGLVNPYQIRNLKVVVEEDNGANLIDSCNASAGDASVLLDGDETTGWRPYVDGQGSGVPSLTLALSRTAQVDNLNLYLVNSLKGQVIVSVLSGGRWERLGDATNGAGLGSGWQTVKINSTNPLDAISLQFKGGDGSSGEIMEAMAQGSGVGGAYGQTLKTTYPDAGQFYGREAYIRGFLGVADDGSGVAQVMLGGIPAQVMNGQFEGIVTKDQVGLSSQADDTAWAVTVTAIYPDGNQLTQVVNLSQQMAQGGGGNNLSGTYAQMLNPGAAAVIDKMGMHIEVPQGAVTGALNLQMLPLTTVDLPPMDPGMTNVTAGARGYRMLPHGTHFATKIKMKFGFDSTLLPSGKTAKDVRTFFFDPERGHWMPLEVSNLDQTGQTLESKTSHFTDFVNATITVPDHPDEVSFNPNQIKDIKAADPGAEINLIEPPGANNQGTANLSYPIEVPPGRKGMQPQLAVQYNSGGGDSWMGVGWDLTCPNITVETRWGAPRYGSQETEDYLLNGEQLVMETGTGTYLAHRSSPFINRTGSHSTPVTFHTRVEGKFERILRFESDPAHYWWEVDQKDGTRMVFGADLESKAVKNGNSTVPPTSSTDPAVLTDDVANNHGNIFEWKLREIEDQHGNVMIYHYSVQPQTLLGGIQGHEIYPAYITYTGISNGSSLSEGLYEVDFKHSSGRPDVMVNAKGRFPRVTTDLLTEIDVKYNGSNGSLPSGQVRAYTFTYKTGAFDKSLLTDIDQYGATTTAADKFKGNHHHFDYFNEIQDATDPSTYHGFDDANEIQWGDTTDKDQYGVDGGTGFLGGLGDGTFDGKVSAIGGSSATGFGGHFYGGISPGGFTKEGSLGIKVGGEETDGHGVLTLIDVDGTGLPAKVFRTSDNRVLFRPNLSSPDGADQFGFSGQVKSLKDSGGGAISDFSKNSDFMISFGPEVYFGVNIYQNTSFNFSSEARYFTDANGDGIPDIVMDDGHVVFGHLDSSGNVVYEDSSLNTPAPLLAAGASVQAQLPDFTAEFITAVNQDPLVDTLNRWVVPYDGVVVLNAPASLIHDDPAEPTDQMKDGVQLMVEQHFESSATPTVVGVATIQPTSTATVQVVPAGTVVVSKGDRIYFRVQSVFEGRFDHVGWDPEIKYQNFPAAVKDANNLDNTRYKPSEDFTTVGRTGVFASMPFTGTASLTGDFVKTGDTSDSVTVAVVRNPHIDGLPVPGSPQTLLFQPVAASGAATVPVNLTGLSFNQGDILQLSILCDTNINLEQLSWSPRLVFTSYSTPTPQFTPSVTPTGTQMPVTMTVPYDAEFYPDNDQDAPQTPLTVTEPVFSPTPAPAYPSPTPCDTMVNPTCTPATPIPTPYGLLHMDSTMTFSGSGLGYSVAVTVMRIPASGTPTPVFIKTIPANTTSIAIAGDFIHDGSIASLINSSTDKLEVILGGVHTQGDLNAITWQPTMYYVVPPPLPGASSSPFGPPPMNTAYKIPLTVDGVTRVRFLNLVPTLKFSTTELGTVYLTMKHRIGLLFKEAINVSVLNLDGTVNIPAPPPQEVTLGDVLFFDYTTRQEGLLADETVDALIGYYGGSRGLVPDIPLDASFNEPHSAGLFAAPYRGWAYAGIKANPTPVTATNFKSPTTPLNEGDLALPTSGPPNPSDPSSVASFFGAQKAVLFLPNPVEGSPRWVDNAFIFAGPGNMSSSRFGAPVISVPQPGSLSGGSPTVTGFGAGARGVTRSSQNIQLGAGAGFGPVNGAAASDNLTGGSTGSSDYIDMNGDGFPSIVSHGQVQYTLPTGGLENNATTIPQLSSGLRNSGNESLNAGIGGDLPVTKSDPKGEGGPTGNNQATNPSSPSTSKSQMRTVGLNGEIGAGDSSSNVEMIDMNGDGLPDRVTTDGSNIFVELNTGYGFGPKVSWGAGAINKSCSTNVSGGAGFNDGVFGWSAGISASDAISKNRMAILDVNGDGLPDLVTTNDDGTWKVNFNTGNGFDPNGVTWTGAFNSAKSHSLPIHLNDCVAQGNPINQSRSQGLGGNACITIPIGIPFLFTMIFNPMIGPDIGVDSSRTEFAVQDIDGDGYPDDLSSSDDGHLSVRHNKAGRTNLLQKVTRPLGATISLEYTRQGNTYADPHSHWNMTKVTVFDGGQNANTAPPQGPMGADYQVTQYKYFKSKYDRFDREPLGYAKVVETQMDTTQGGAGSTTAYREIDRAYLTTSVYDKGLMTDELTLRSSDGVSFLETQNQFQEFNVDTQAPVDDAPSTTAIQEVLFPELTQTIKLFYEGGTGTMATTQTFSYDGTTGNVTGFGDSGDANVADSAVSATISYLSTQNPYLVGLPTTIFVTDPSVAVSSPNSVLRHREALYNGLGDLSEVRQYLADGTFAASDLFYDGNGNMVTFIGPSNQSNTSPTNYKLFYQYDGNVSTYPVKVTDVSGYASTTNYDFRFGKPVSQVDENGHNIYTAYDEFSRTVTVQGPFEQAGDQGHEVTSNYTIQFDYHPDNIDPITSLLTPYAHTAHFDGFRNTADPIETLLYTDGLKRVIQTKKDDTFFTGKLTAAKDMMTVSGRVVFDQVGRTISQSYPVTETKGPVLTGNTTFNTAFDSVMPTVMQYDVLDRNTLTTIPDGTSTSIGYSISNDNALSQFKTHVVDADTNAKDTYRDVRELISQVNEYNPGTPGQAVISTTYTYDPVKQIIGVKDANNNQTNVTYDLLGRRTSINNPDTGLTTMTYDLASNVIRKVTANLAALSKAITYVYDQNNRLTNINYPVFTRNNVTYTYGLPNQAGQGNGNIANRIAEVDDGSGSELRKYDALGNIVQETKILKIPHEVDEPFHFGTDFEGEGNQSDQFGYHDHGLHLGEDNHWGGFWPEWGDNFDHHQSQAPSQGGGLGQWLGWGLNDDHADEDKDMPLTFITQYTYDTWNRLQNMTYPDGEVLTYKYDSGGLPNAVSGMVPSEDEVFPYVLRLEYDKFEQRVFVQNGNGTQQTYSYVPTNRRLSQLQGLACGVTFQNLNYTYDNVGNINFLVNSIPSPQEQELQAPVSQSFIYDNLYRLTKATGTVTGCFDPDEGHLFDKKYKLSMNYDKIHNITHKKQRVFRKDDEDNDADFYNDNAEDNGEEDDHLDQSLTYDWNYQYNSTHPHAPTVIGDLDEIPNHGRNFVYDLNGNQLGYETFFSTHDNGPDRNIIWDEENRMAAVGDDDPGVNETNSGDTNFVYNDQGTRVFKIHGGTINAYINQFYTIQNLQKDPPTNGQGNGHVATKHIFIGTNRIASHVVEGKNDHEFDQGNGDGQGFHHGQGDFGGQGEHSWQWGNDNQSWNHWCEHQGNNGEHEGDDDQIQFVTALTSGVTVFSKHDGHAKVLGTIDQCQTLTLRELRAEDGYYEVQFQGAKGFVSAASVTVGIPGACVGVSPNTSVIPQNDFVFFYHSDHLGSTGYMTDGSGRLTEHLEYIPFGETWIEEREGMQLFPAYQFTGKELDTETGLYYYGARYYDPRTSVWQSADKAMDKFLPNSEKISFGDESWLGPSQNSLEKRLKIYYDPREKEWKYPGQGIAGDVFSDSRFEKVKNGGIYNSTNLGMYTYSQNNPVIYLDPDGLTTWSNTKYFFSWLFGMGDPVRIYGPNSLESKEMATSPGVNALRNKFYANGGNNVKGYYDSMKAGWETLLNPRTASWGNTSAEVGGFAGAMVINNGDGTMTFYIPNVSGMKSFFYHAVPDSPFSVGPMRNITQYFIWAEKIDESKIRQEGEEGIPGKKQGPIP